MRPQESAPGRFRAGHLAQKAPEADWSRRSRRLVGAGPNQHPEPLHSLSREGSRVTFVTRAVCAPRWTPVGRAEYARVSC
jgi:hypothetical protein